MKKKINSFRFSVLLTCVITLIVGYSVGAAKPLAHDGVTFVYEPKDGTYPHSLGGNWEKVTNLSDAELLEKMVIEDHTLKVHAGISSTLYWIIHAGNRAWENVDFSYTPVTIELSLRVVEHGSRDDEQDEVAFQVYFEDGNSQAYIRFREDGVMSSNIRQMYEMDASVWHDYRFEIAEGNVTLYVDNDPDPKYAWALGKSNRTGRIHFGDTSGAWGGKYELRSMKYTIHYPSDD